VSEGHSLRRAALVSRPVAAAESIGRRIVSGNWKPGSVLPSFDQLADEFSVSRLSVREAMRALAAKGLVDSKPRRGTVVRPRSDWSRLDPDVLTWQIGDAPNAAFVRSLFEARSIIEPEAAALVALRATEDVLAAIDRAFSVMSTTDKSSIESIEADVDFHQAILIGTGNELVAAFAPAIGTWLRVAIGVQRAAVPDQQNFVPQHGAILQAIKRGDSDGARAAFRVLLTRAESDAMQGVRIWGKADERPSAR
jgi:GntR family transcriptional regulator, galactonate operon transcriptional repressor